ncbi:MAG: ribonuclease III [Limisphaerales bacterium]
MPDLSQLQTQLGHTFQNQALLNQALTHPSLVRDEQSPNDNQRLEFLGDAVLQLTITAELFHRFPASEEGPLTKARAQLVNRSSLAEHASQLQLGQYLRLSRGEESSGGRNRESTLADALEALIGALFLDGGFEPARKFVLAQFQNDLGALTHLPNLDNPKGELQEKLQAASHEAPVYRLESTSGPDHDRRFISVVYHQSIALGRGEGRSKKNAESEAARNALDQLSKKQTGEPAQNGFPGTQN